MSERMIRVGDHVEDRDADDPNTGLVISRSGLSADEHVIGEHSNQTVADVNGHYPASDGVVSVAYPDATAGSLSTKQYAYPVSRLRVVASLHEVAADE